MNLSAIRKAVRIDYSRLKNPILLFTLSRYAGYGLKFIQSILVARFLGPYFLGIWGFLLLVQQYLLYTSLGLQSAINVELATDLIHEPEQREKAINASLSAMSMVTALLCLSGLGIWILRIPLFEKYSFNHYAAAVGVVIGLTHFQQLFASIYRVYRKLTRIAIGELLNAASLLFVTFAFRDRSLILALLGAMILSGIVSNAIFIVKAPFRITLSPDIKCTKKLLALGIPLLIYTFSFYLITMAARTIISIFYSVEMMGYYSLANSITNATLLGLNAMAWVVFPEVLSRTREGLADDVVAKTVQKVNDLYSTSVFLTVFGAIMALPLLFLFLPQYKPAEGVLAILLLSQAMLSISFGYNCVAIARKKQLKVAAISIIAVVVVTSLGLLVAFFEFHFVWIAVSVLAGSFVYTILQARIGARILNRDDIQAGYLRDILPLGTLLATLLVLVGSLSGYTTIGGLIGFVIFLVTNKNKLKIVWGFIFEKTRVIGTA